MGYDLELFENREQISKELICRVCQDVLEDAVMLVDCQHMYCRVCITRWLKKSKTCPLDREELKTRLNLHAAPRPIINLLNDLRRRCQFVCGSIITVGDTISHEKNCKVNPARRTPCENECGANLTNAEKEMHNCLGYLKELVQTLTNNSLQLHEYINKQHKENSEMMDEIEEQAEVIQSLKQDIKTLKEDLKYARKPQSSKMMIASNGTKSKTPKSPAKLPSPPKRQINGPLTRGAVNGKLGVSPQPQKRRRGS